jgi:hypothetical protein
MKQKILPMLLILIFAASVFAQTNQENLLENVEIKFTLESEPTPQDVGFDNPKSFWKVKYELYLTDFSEMEKLGLRKIHNGLKYLSPIVRDKSFNKRIKKKSIKISKGNFAKKSLSIETNREVIIPINLPPNVIEIYNQAVKIPEKNPTFVLFVTEKVSVKNSAKAKLKEKYLITGFRPLKHSASNQNHEYWNVRNISLNISVARREDGKLQLFGGLVH